MRDPARADPTGLVGFGADLAPETLVDAYHRGIFPWPHDGVALPWFSPDPRAVLTRGGIRLSRSLRRRMRSSGWETTVDAQFDAVVAACAQRPAGEGTWITDDMRQAYGRLHRLGWAHSLEVWQGPERPDRAGDTGPERPDRAGDTGPERPDRAGDTGPERPDRAGDTGPERPDRAGDTGPELVAGLYGVAVGACFTGESMFHRASDASKVALVDFVDRWQEAGGELFDVQLPTEHLRSMGAVEMPRVEFLARLELLRGRPVPVALGRRSVTRLVR